MMILTSAQQPGDDPVRMILSILAGLALVVIITICFQGREEIAAVVRTIFHRYFRFRWYGVPRDDDIMSRLATLNYNPSTTVLADANQHEPASTEPVREPVRPTRMADDDIIIWLANLKKPGQSDYRFSANAIVKLIGGTEAEVKRKIREAAPERSAVPLSSARAGEIVDVISLDPARPHQQTPVREDDDGTRYVELDGQRQLV